MSRWPAVLPAPSSPNVATPDACRSFHRVRPRISTVTPRAHTGTFSRDNASTPNTPLCLPFTPPQAPSKSIVTHFEGCQIVSLVADAWPSVGGPLVGHWGQQTLGLTAASPQRNLHHHKFPPHMHCHPSLTPSLATAASSPACCSRHTQRDKCLSKDRGLQRFELRPPCLPGEDCGHPAGYSRLSTSGRACAESASNAPSASPHQTHTPSRATLPT